MAEYSLLITVDPKQVKYLNNWEYQLCFATSCQIDGASPTMTVSDDLGLLCLQGCHYIC